MTEVTNGRKTGEPTDVTASDEELIRQLTERAQARLRGGDDVYDVFQAGLA